MNLMPESETDKIFRRFVYIISCLPIFILAVVIYINFNNKNGIFGQENE